MKFKIHPFSGLRGDLKGFVRRYKTDWHFNQLILASSVFIFFGNLLPGITFASDLYELTGQYYGTIEVVFSTGLVGFIFSLVSAQPLTISGVTGPFSILSEQIYKICVSLHIPFLQFMCWSCIHAAWMLIILSILNAHNWTMRYVTTFSTEVFSLLNSVIYFFKTIQVIQRNHERSEFQVFLYSILGCVGTALTAILFTQAQSFPVLHRYVRMIIAEYAAAVSIILWTAIPHMSTELERALSGQITLPISTSFHPTNPSRSHFFVNPFDQISTAAIFAALIPGFIITALFFFDHEISSIICTYPRYNLKKPGGYYWDIALLGCTTFICGLLGIPPGNGLLPQAPLHTESLLHKDKRGEETAYEQRWSSLLHSLGILAFLAPPLMHILGLIPTSVLAGLFFFMGYESLISNDLFWRMLKLITWKSELPELPPNIRWRQVNAYSILQIIFTAIIFGLTFSPAAAAFPLLIVVLVPFRLKVMNRFWSKEVLDHVDSWATIEDKKESLGGNGKDAKDIEKGEAKVATTSNDLANGRK